MRFRTWQTLTKSRLWPWRNIEKAAFDPKATFRKPPMTSRYRYRYLHLGSFFLHSKGDEHWKKLPNDKEENYEKVLSNVFTNYKKCCINFVYHKNLARLTSSYLVTKENSDLFFLTFIYLKLYYRVKIITRFEDLYIPTSAWTVGNRRALCRTWAWCPVSWVCSPLAR